MPKINLHCHTTYSDGQEPLALMLLEHQKQGFSAFVVTDHLKVIQRLSDYKKSLSSVEEVNKQRKELNSLSKYLNYPCIQGVELWLREEEILLFGIDVIREVIKYIEEYDGNNIYIDTIRFIKEHKNRCACILCHPRLLPQYHPYYQEYYKELFSILDGYERYNCGQDWFLNREIPEELRNLKPFYNSDSHTLGHIETGNNQHNRPIKRDEDLIKYIKGRLF